MDEFTYTPQRQAIAKSMSCMREGVIAYNHIVHPSKVKTMKEYVPNHFLFLVDWTIKLHPKAPDQSKGMRVLSDLFF